MSPILAVLCQWVGGSSGSHVLEFFISSPWPQLDFFPLRSSLWPVTDSSSLMSENALIAALLIAWITISTMSNIVFQQIQNVGPAPRTCKECVATTEVAYPVAYSMCKHTVHPPPHPTPHTHPQFRASLAGPVQPVVQFLQKNNNTTNSPRLSQSRGPPSLRDGFWMDLLVNRWADEHMQRHEERDWGEGVLERGPKYPSTAAKKKRPHSRITSQKRLASRDAGNRMAFVSFRIMSSPGHITGKRDYRHDTNVITGEGTLPVTTGIYYGPPSAKFMVNIHDL